MMFKELVSTAEFASWLVKAQPEDRIIYGTGSYLPAEKPEVAESVYRSCGAGQVLLAQKKIAPASYNYIAIRVSSNLINKKMRAGR